MYKILKMEGRAKRAHMETVHGNIETPDIHECRNRGSDQGSCFH